MKDHKTTLRSRFTESTLKLTATGIVVWLFTGLCVYTTAGGNMEKWQFFVAVFFAVAAGLLHIFKLEIKPGISIVLYQILPLCSFWLIERFSHNPFTDIKKEIAFLNILFYYALFELLFFVIGKTKVAGIVGLFIPLFAGVANYFVVSFRSSPIVPWDFYSIRVAASVADNYEFAVDFYFLLVVIGFAALMALIFKTTFTAKKISVRVPGAAVMAILFVFYIGMVQTRSVESTFGLDDTLFTPNVLYRNNGFTVSFLKNLRYIRVEKPEGYSLDTVEGIIDELEIEEAETGKKPNVIVIMNEAFSDLAVLGDFETNEDYMPFIRSLEENAIKGDLYVSVKGGNTASTEFEFLTGNSHAFLPQGSVAYQQYIREETPSLAWWLKSMGYETSAIHPYNASGWQRERVYPLLGFDQSYFRRDFYSPELVRDYVSDWATYEKVIEIYEAKEDSVFIFDVTMQNHGSYFRAHDVFEEYIHLEDYSGAASTERYLTLIKESDNAFERLVAYFEAQEEETIILMFGDHQPADYVVRPIFELNGKSMENMTMEEEQKQYIVPYIVWANYEIDQEVSEDVTSISYLSGLLLEAAGVPLNGYQQYLRELQEEAPVITANIYIDSDGKMHAASDGVDNILKEYSILQYNQLFDVKNRFNQFFGLE